MSANFFSYAGNFRDMDNIGVDPRTGQFIVNIPLENIIGNNLLGPELPLKLSYNPLDRRNQGFGIGFSLAGLSQFNRQTNLLELSNGETWKIEPFTTNICHHPGKDFRFAYNNKKDDKNGYCIYWKDGRIETLDTVEGKAAFVTTYINDAAQVFRIALEWNWNSSYPLLTKVSDNYRTLYKIDYGNSPVISIWPDTDEVYQINCELIENSTRLGRIFYNIGSKSTFSWSFKYASIEGSDGKLITEVVHPSGMTEKVGYSSVDGGLPFPKGSNMQPLPVVMNYIRDPKCRQPETTINYTYTKNNFLGGPERQFSNWSSDEDYIYKTLTDYTYGTTKSITKDGRTVTIIYEYNNYHLTMNEAVDADGIVYQTDFTYYAQYRAPIDKQTAQFQYLRQKKETWKNAGNIIHQQSTRTEFDEYGNILREVTPIINREMPGRTIITEWYPAEGYPDFCPPEPNGFIRFMQQQTIIPMQTEFDTPTNRIFYTYSQLGPTKNVMLKRCSVYSNDSWLNDQHFLYESDPQSGYFGHITSISDINIFCRSLLEFSASLSDGKLDQAVKRTGHDGIHLTCSYSRSVLSGRLLRKADKQDVRTDYTYDKLGRILSRIDAAGSKYSNQMTWSYAVEGESLVTTIQDARDNKVKSYSDGEGQIIRRQRCNADRPDEWYDIFIAPSQVSDTDTMLSGAVSIAPTSLPDSAGTEDMEIAKTEGEIVVTSDKRNGQPVKISWVDHSGTEVSKRQYFWDGLGQLRTEIDELENITRYTYDAYGRLLTKTLPDCTVITYDYAPHLTGNQITSVSVTGLDKDGLKQTWKLGEQIFDSLGRLTWQIIGGRSTRYTYSDASPMPMSITRPSGRSENYNYIPELDNAIKSVNVDGISQNFSYYPKIGRIKEASEAGVLQYNNLSITGRLLSQDSRIDTRTGSGEYNWSQTGALLAYKDMTEAESGYTYNSDGQIIKINDKNLIVNLEYDDKGRISKRTVKDASSNLKLTTELVYNDFDREVNRTLSDEIGNTLILRQAWQKNGLLSSRLAEIQNGETLRREDYQYDWRNRLTSYKVSGPILPSDAYGHDIMSQTYRYDALDNIISVETLLHDGSIDRAIYFYENNADPTQLTYITHTHSFYPSRIDLTYNAEGQLRSEQAQQELTYDALGRLVRIKQVSDNSIAEYKYDAFSRLVGIVFDDQKHDFYYRGDKRVNEVVTETSSQKQRFIEFDNSYLAVHDGTNLMLTGTDQNGSLVWSRGRHETRPTLYSWTPYGGSALVHLPGFNGEWSDPICGVYHLGNGYRVYNPKLMRFESPDNLSPFGAGGINLYAYCNGDPVNYIDPFGHMSWEAILGIVLGSIGLAATAVMGGLGIAAAGGVMAALSSASAGTLLVDGLGVAADVAGIASGALEDTDPQKSSALGWLSLGLGVGSIGMASRAFIKSYSGYNVLKSGELLGNSSDEMVTLGGNMRDVDILSNGLYTFTDTYKNADRLNIVAHGERIGEGAELVVNGPLSGLRNMDADELATVLKSRYNLDDYANLRTIACHSGTGGCNSFGARLSQLTGKPVKSYLDGVTGNFEADALTKLFRIAENRGIYEEFSATFPLKHTFQIRKTNPFKIYEVNHYTWSYQPVHFAPKIS